ncbi:MAG: SMI1/KNR4 family protein [Gemmataceae bacterium]
MVSNDWPRLFSRYEIQDTRPGLNPDYIPLVDRLIAEPLSNDERAEIESRATSDPQNWVMPSRPLPPSYLSLLAWSNGGLFVDGEQEFDLLGAQELREYLLQYEFPANLPGAVPFASDGNGGFYFIDTRNECTSNGEYPILHCRAGRYTFDDAEAVADSFPACFGEPR